MSGVGQSPRISKKSSRSFAYHAGAPACCDEPRRLIWLAIHCGSRDCGDSWVSCNYKFRKLPSLCANKSHPPCGLIVYLPKFLFGKTKYLVSAEAVTDDREEKRRRAGE